MHKNVFMVLLFFDSRFLGQNLKVQNFNLKFVTINDFIVTVKTDVFQQR